MVESIRRRPLDRSRPLWELWVIPGLGEHSHAVYLRVHHVIADGPAGVAMLGVLLDAAPDVPLTPAPPRHEEKIDDVLLSVFAEGLRELLCRRGEPADDVVLRAVVPVSLHGQQSGPARGSLLGQMIVRLPVGNTSLGAGAFSYAGRFTITVVGDSVVCPEVDVVARGMEEAPRVLRGGRPSECAVVSGRPT